MITAEKKVKVQKNGNVHYYIYYHCTKNNFLRCWQPSIEEEELKKQILIYLGRLKIDKGYKDWAIGYLPELNKEEVEDQSATYETLQKRYNDAKTNLRELIKMRYSGEIDRE